MTDDFHNQDSFHVLKKLQEQMRSNMPAMIAQRSMSSFSLQQEPPPDRAYNTIFVVVYPQNPFAGKPEVREMHAEDIQSGLVNSRIQIQDSRGVLALPDEEGNYLYWPDTPEFDQVNAFYFATYTLRMFERYAHRQIPWSFPAARITINPHVGDLANAFYNEHERLLGFHSFASPSGGQQSTAQSADIVAHETAHAVLDGLRDLWNESFGLGARAFHESFSDMAAMLVALHDDSLMRRLLEWTKGNLKMSNFISEVAEQLTDALNQTLRFNENTIYLRNGFNTLTSKPFDELHYVPTEPETDLGRQEHNYSRLFTGAFYDIWVGIYERFKDHNSPEFVALVRARDVIGHLLIMAVEVSPVGELSFSDMAKAFLTADAVLYNSKYHAILRYVFDKRGILNKADADAHREYRSSLPDVRLPEAINNALAAAQFLESTLLPELDIKPSETLIPLSTYRNAEGYAFLNYFNSQTMILEGSQFKGYEGATLDMFGGLTLMFDKYNRLQSVCYRPIDEEDKRQIKVIVEELISYDKITEQVHASNQALEPSPNALFIEEALPNDGSKLVKYPVIIDEMPKDVSDLKEYLEQWESEA
jgi:hypothetical protein